MNNNSFKDLTNRVFKSGNPAMLYIGINVVVFLVVGIAVLFVDTNFINGFVRTYLGFPADITAWPTRFYTLVTYAFLHQDIFHILFNLLWLYWMGNLFLSFLKPKQFHVVYWGGALLGAISFALIFNFNPKLNALNASGATLIGASAAVMAIFSAITTLIPNYSFRLLLFGDVKLKYLWIAYLVLIILTSANTILSSNNSSIIGGALFGFVYIKLLQNGTDLSSFFEKKPKMRVVKNDAPKKRASVVNQDEIDAVLDKISKSGYEKLTAKEKQILFDASKN